jgi:hypothetical protein
VAVQRLAELLRQRAQQPLLPQIAAGARDLGAQRLGQAEMLEQRDGIGEGLVKGQHVGVGRLAHAPVQPVEQRVRDLVRDDVVREAGEDQLAGAAFSAWLSK